MNYSEINLVLRRDNCFFRLYNDHENYRVYWGMRCVYEGNEISLAYRAYNGKVI